MQLLMIRHAQSLNNAGEDDPNYQHIEDAPLSQIGFSQANHLASAVRRDVDDVQRQALLDEQPHLPIFRAEVLLVSPMQRALQTAKPLAEALQLAPQVHMDIYEDGGVFQQVGQYGAYQYVGCEGLTRAQMLAILPDAQIPTTVTDERGWWAGAPAESDADFQMRGRRVAAYLHEQAAGAWAGRWVAMVAHADLINWLLKCLLVEEAIAPYKQSYICPYNTSVTRLDFSPERVVLRYFSNVAHLPVEMVTK